MTTKQLSIKTNVLWNSIGSLTYLGCQWLITVFVVRLSSGYDDAGLLSLAMAVVSFFNTLANYKMGTYQVSDIDHENTLGEYLGFRCLMLGISFVLCVVYSLISCPLYAVITIALYYFFMAVGLVIDVLHGTDQQNRRMDYIGISFIIRGFLILGAFLFTYGISTSLNLAIISMTLASVLVLLLYDIPRTAQFEKVYFFITRQKFWFFLKNSFPVVVASLASSAVFTIPKQYLVMTLGESALGIYSSVAALALIVQMSATYLYVPLLDLLPRLFFKESVSNFSRLLLRTTALIIGATAIIAIILIFLGMPLLSFLFGESIVPYVYLLQPVLLSTATTAFLWFYGDTLIALRDFKTYFIGNFVAFVMVIPASVVCVNYWGMNGVSFAIAIACACGIVVLIYGIVCKIKQQRKNMKIKYE